jgi:hypothetical protein
MDSSRKKIRALMALLLLAAALPLHAARAARAESRPKKERKAKAPRRNPLAEAREALNAGDFSGAIAAYHAQLQRRDNSAARAEYALALALQGLRDLALAQLDEAAAEKPLEGESRALASLCFRALGYPGIAKGMGAQDGRPEWLKREIPAGRAQGDPRGMAFGERVLNANRLAAQGQPHLACAEFADLSAERPQDFLIPVGQSIALQRIRAFGAAEDALLRAKPLAKTPAAKSLVAARQKQLKEAEARPARAAEPLTPEQARYMVFGGGQFGQGAGSLNGRVGYFLTPHIDAGVDLGVQGMGGSSSGGSSGSNLSLGVSTRYYIPVKKAGNVVVGGRVGLAGGQASLTLSPGLSSPFGDIFVDLNLAQSGVSLGFTVGATTFFGGKK